MSGCFINPSSAGYTHVIILGANDIIHLLAAFTRYAIGLALEESGVLEEPYEDPVPFENVFEIVDSVPQLTLDPLLTVSRLLQSPLLWIELTRDD